MCTCSNIENICTDIKACVCVCVCVCNLVYYISSQCVRVHVNESWKYTSIEKMLLFACSQFQLRLHLNSINGIFTTYDKLNYTQCSIKNLYYFIL